MGLRRYVPGIKDRYRLQHFATPSRRISNKAVEKFGCMAPFALNKYSTIDPSCLLEAYFEALLATASMYKYTCCLRIEYLSMPQPALTAVVSM